MALIPIPQNWMNPRFEFGNRVRVEYPASDLRLTGIIIGMRYFPDEALTKPEEWEYDIVTDDGTILEPTPEDWIYLESQDSVNQKVSSPRAIAQFLVAQNTFF